MSPLSALAFYDEADAETTIANHVAYNAFGRKTSETNAAVDCVFAYTGRLLDDDTGLQNHLHRWYDPETAKWLSEDPIGFEAGDANLTRWVGNAGTTGVDPDGRKRRTQASLRVRGYDAIDDWASFPTDTRWTIIDAPAAGIATILGNLFAKPAVWVATNWREDTASDRINSIKARQQAIVKSEEMSAYQAFLNLYCGATTDQIAFGAVGFDPYQNRHLDIWERTQRTAAGTAGYAATWVPVAAFVQTPTALAATTSSVATKSSLASFSYYAGAGIDPVTGAISLSPGLTTTAYAGVGIDAATGAVIISRSVAGSVATTAVVGPSENWLVIDRYGTLSKSPLSGQAHHLNQTAAYRDVIPFQEGVSIKLEGNVFTEVGAPHTNAHLSMEGFWNQYRATGSVPTNLQYTQALQQSLRASGQLSETQVRQAVRAAIRERIQYGQLGGIEVPRVPGPIRNIAQ